MKEALRPLLHLCDTLPEGCGYFFYGLCLSAFTLIVRVYPECHLHSCMTSEILDLLDVETAFEQPCNIGVSKLMSGNREVEGADDFSVPDSSPQLICRCCCAAVDNIHHSFETALCHW